MKNRLIRIVTFICAIMMICAVFVHAAAEGMPATPTDLTPDEETVQEQTEQTPAEEVPAEATVAEPAEEPAEPETVPAEEPEGEPEDEAAEPETVPAEEPEEKAAEAPADEPKEEPAEEQEEESSDSMEIMITKAVWIGDGWEGKVSRTRPAVLKLDLEYTRTVYLVIEGKGVRVTAAKTDSADEILFSAQTDPETERAVMTWNAGAGSYLITVSPDENSLMSRAKVSFMNEEAYQAWEEQINEAAAAETAETDEEGNAADPSETTEEITEATDEPEDEAAFTLPENRSIRIDISWDTEHPQIGDTAHFNSVITGYENYSYTLQWQISRDEENWTDYIGATNPQLDVVLTEELNGTFFRLVIYVESEQEA